MDDIWIISWFNYTAFDANPIWKSPSQAWLTFDRKLSLCFAERCICFLLENVDIHVECL